MTAGSFASPGGSGSRGSVESVPSFIFLFVVAILVSIGLAVWKVSTAQRLAKQSGMDPGLATRMTLLTDDGLDATYLAASMRQPPAPRATPAPESAARATPGSAAERLTDLKSLLDQGLVTRTEYDERRKAIIDTV